MREHRASIKSGLEAELRELQCVKCAKIFREQVSSVAVRAQLEAVLEFVWQGDVLVGDGTPEINITVLISGSRSNTGDSQVFYAVQLIKNPPKRVNFQFFFIN